MSTTHPEIMIYIAGPFSAPTREGVEANIRKAELVGLEIARMGYYPVIPHANTSLPEFESAQPYEFWIEGTKALLRACHGLVLVDGWEKSSGARGELSEALRLGMPVFGSPGDIVTPLRACYKGYWTTVLKLADEEANA